MYSALPLLTRMSKKVLYLHGYGSTGETDTAKNLRIFLSPEFELISPTYDCSNPRLAASQLTSVMESLDSSNIVVVGTSLGGFFANYLSRQRSIPAVLVNPSLHPSKSLAKYGESEEALAGYAELEAAAGYRTATCRRIVVLGMEDTVLDHKENGLQLTDAAVVALKMGHRISPEYYTTIAGLIRELAQA